MDYAAQRLAKMRRNEEVLVSLGLRTPPPEESKAAKPSSTAAKPKRKPLALRGAITPPRNVSTRALIKATTKCVPAARLEPVTSLINKDHDEEDEVETRPWTEREDNWLLYYYFIKGDGIRSIARRVNRLEDDVPRRLRKWNLEGNLEEQRTAICQLVPVSPCCISPAHLWTQTQRGIDNPFSTHDLLDFHDLDVEEQNQWQARWVKQRARYFRQAQQAKHQLPAAQRERLRNLNHLPVVRRGEHQKLPEEEDFAYFLRVIKPQVDDLYRYRAKRAKKMIVKD
ncbi:hypothetical protein BASA81_002501 [Batrachochytrium salamandrivorans]|nr:hypothetical protein BASA81_002501 [Batrachochytrium salamandrivorans]